MPVVRAASARRPDTLWLNLSLYNTGLCIVLYREGLPARVVAVNDSGQLPDRRGRISGVDALVICANGGRFRLSYRSRAAV